MEEDASILTTFGVNYISCQMKSDALLVIGACGQIGAELTAALRAVHGVTRVIAADLKPPSGEWEAEGPYEQLDVLNRNALSALIARYQVNQVYLLAAMLPATGEKYPPKAWHLNMQSLLHVLDLAVEKKIDKVFWPSSIAVFGPGAPRHGCPQGNPPDAIRASLELMTAPAANLTIRTSYNISAISFTPEELARSIGQYIPDCRVAYQPDWRQDIADGWPGSIDDTTARLDWQWRHAYGLSSMTLDMLLNLAEKQETHLPLTITSSI